MFQEYAFGTYTWTYSSFNLNLNGRIYLPYCIGWGIFSYIWIQYCWPIYLKVFNKLYSKRFVILSYIIFVYLIYNIALSTLITIRYSKRARGLEATNAVAEYIDKHYPDELVKKKFPKMRVITK